MLPLQAHTPARLAEALGIPLPDARKIVSAVHRDEPLEKPLAGVRRASLRAARDKGHVPALGVRAIVASQIDPFVKLALAAPDGRAFEAVRIPLEKKGRFSACVSSQVGCALGCTFCATGRMGLVRNLETWEIVEQVRVIRRTIPRGEGRVHGVVFQGMGEPMANLDRVLDAIDVLTDPCALAIDARNVTVSTSGLPTGIRRLAREAPRVRLAVSIGSARRDVRRSILPIEDKHGLDEVIDACEEHARTTGLAPLWAVTPLAGVNDGEDDARALATLAKTFASRTGIRPRISVIPYNPIGDGDPFARSGGDGASAMREAMAKEGVYSHVRYSGGGDVAAACGQLANRSGR